MFCDSCLGRIKNSINVHIIDYRTLFFVKNFLRDDGNVGKNKKLKILMINYKNKNKIEPSLRGGGPKEDKKKNRHRK